MKHKWNHIVFFLLLSINLHCQESGARNNALGSSFLTQTDIISASNNISQLSYLNSFSIGLTTHNNYLLKELQYSQIAIGIPLFKSNLALAFSTYGFHLYHEYKFSIAFAKQLSPQFSLGLKLNYHLFYFGENLGRSGIIYPDIAASYRFSKKIELGVLFQNITLAKKHETWKQIWPVSSQLGLKYKLNSLTKLFLEGALYLENNFNLRSGLEYHVHRILSLRVGIESNPASFSFGFGILLRQFHLDFATSYQSTLGFRPSISIRYAKTK
jgi:hypothetical protein